MNGESLILQLSYIIINTSKFAWHFGDIKYDPKYIQLHLIAFVFPCAVSL